MRCSDRSSHRVIVISARMRLRSRITQHSTVHVTVGFGSGYDRSSERSVCAGVTVVVVVVVDEYVVRRTATRSIGQRSHRHASAVGCAGVMLHRIRRRCAVSFGFDRRSGCVGWWGGGFSSEMVVVVRGVTASTQSTRGYVRKYHAKNLAECRCVGGFYTICTTKCKIIGVHLAFGCRLAFMYFVYICKPLKNGR